MRLRPIDQTDWRVILQLNEQSVDLVSPLESAALGVLLGQAFRAVAADADGEVAAFAVLLTPGTAYESPNYGWFCDRYAEFLYLDRIVVAEPWRRQGVATMVYEAMEDLAAEFGRLVCEVDFEPPNEPSLRFHAARGYRQVGLTTNARGKVLAMLAKELPWPSDTSRTRR
jgi:predicted GNAT superfamily acetyltransferase